jgi:hypothetical protein
MANLTLKRVLKRHKQNPQDKKLHSIINSQQMDERKFDKTVDKN